MHSAEARRQALDLINNGSSLRSVSAATGINRSTLFSNKSLDILALCGQALDRLGVEWRYARWDVISVAKRDAVARLDEFVEPKY